MRQLAKSLSWEHLRPCLTVAVNRRHMSPPQHQEPFPANRQALENAPLLVLMAEYLKLNFRNEIVRKGTVANCCTKASYLFPLTAYMLETFVQTCTGTIKMCLQGQCHHLYGILRPISFGLPWDVHDVLSVKMNAVRP